MPAAAKVQHCKTPLRSHQSAHSGLLIIYPWQRLVLIQKTRHSLFWIDL